MQNKVQELIGVMATAEQLIIQDQNNPRLSMNNQHLDKVQEVFKKLKQFQGMQVSGTLVDNYNYALRYLYDTLFIAGRIH